MGPLDIIHKCFDWLCHYMHVQDLINAIRIKRHVVLPQWVPMASSDATCQRHVCGQLGLKQLILPFVWLH